MTTLENEKQQGDFQLLEVDTLTLQIIALQQMFREILGEPEHLDIKDVFSPGGNHILARYEPVTQEVSNARQLLLEAYGHHQEQAELIRNFPHLTLIWDMSQPFGSSTHTRMGAVRSRVGSSGFESLPGYRDRKKDDLPSAFDKDWRTTLLEVDISGHKLFGHYHKKDLTINNPLLFQKG
jgi:hypothetical protein